MGRYPHRVALSNQRLLGYDGAAVTFTWKDYRARGQQKVMRLEVEEFLRRFLLHVLLHVLPPGFKRIRHYGLLACRGRSERRGRCRLLLLEALAASVEALAESAEESAGAAAAGLLEEPWRQCPVCGARLHIRLWVWPKGCGPPQAWQQTKEEASVWQEAA